MDQSPKGRTIEYLDGNGTAIVNRGNQITALGDDMIESAATLKKIADGATGQKGLAVDKLKDVVGDCYKDLKLAGERYKPTGPALVSYGNTVEDLQPKIKSIVDDAETDWQTYSQKSGAVPAVNPALYEEDGSPEQKQAQKDFGDATTAANSAYDTWKGDAETFDGYYDTWEEAFDKAVNDIGEANSGGIEDSFWDDLDGFVAAALKVLQWVGLALAIACLIIGGPILAALAAIVAIATLALTIYSYCRGNSTLSDLIFAVVGVIPFGSAGKLLQGGKRLSFLSDMVGGMGKGGLRAMRGNLSNWANAAHALPTGFTRGGQGLSGLWRGLKGSYRAAAGPYGAGGTNLLSRIFTGRNASEFAGNGPHPLSTVLGIWGDGFTKTIFGIPDAIGNFHNTWFSPNSATA